MMAVVGCQEVPRAVDLGPQLDTAGNPRSVAMDSALLNYLVVRQDPAHGLPWYADRNDHTPVADGGYRLPTVESSVTYTRDRQYHSNGRVHDQFNSTTYRSEHRQIVR